MNDLGALWYLDSRRFIHAVIGIVKRPARLIPWAVILLFFGAQLALRRGSRSTLPFPFTLDAHIAGAIVIAVAGAIALILWSTAAAGRMHASTAPIDALFLSRSSIPQQTVAAWLYGRYFVITYGRSIAAFVYLCLVVRTFNAAPVLSLSGMMLAVEMLRIPVAHAGLRHRWIAAVFLALSIACGVALALDLLVIDLHAAPVLFAVLHANAVALWTIYGIAILALVAGWRSARDIYPEIYAVSAARAARLQRRVRGSSSFAPSTRALKPTRSGTTVLSGPWVEIWKQLAFLRRGNATTTLALGLVFSIGWGVAAGLAERHSAWAGAMMLVGFSVVCIFALTLLSVTLALDIAKPLWWLGQGSVFEKLCAWSIGSSIPVTVMIAIAAVAEAGIAGPQVLPLFLTIAVILPAPTRGLGAFIYSVLPNRIDQRGPGVMLRILILYVAFGLAGAVGLGVGLVFRSGFAGLVAGSLTFSLVGAVALALAAARIDGRGVEFALAE